MRHSVPTLCCRAAVALAAVTLTPSLFAQAAAKPLAQPATSSSSSPSYAAESGVIEHADSLYTYAADGTYVFERSISVRVQSEAMVRALGVITVPFASGT